MNEIEKIILKKLTITSLAKLRNNQVILIKHEYIDNLTLLIRKDYIESSLNNMRSICYGNDFIIEDTINRIHPKHNILLSKSEAAEYVNTLLECRNIMLFNYTRTLKEKNILLGEIIEFENGKQGIICLPNDEYCSFNLHYIPLKTNGELSKCKPRVIYAGTKIKGLGVYKQLNENK